MAQIDVTELLSDPDFVDVMVQIHRTTALNSFGENVISETSFTTIGSIQPASGKAIQRLPEELRVASISSFWLKGEIVATAPGQYTDILVFRGKRYQVINILDWTNFGAGWCEGMCVAEVPA